MVMKSAIIASVLNRMMFTATETKGLTEAFKEFLKPKTIIETLKEKKRVAAERAALPKKQAKRGHVR